MVTPLDFCCKSKLILRTSVSCHEVGQINIIYARLGMAGNAGYGRFSDTGSIIPA
jgi:hypothetical protein